MAQSLVCNDCGLQLKSVKEATDHNEATGHADFAESVEKVIVQSAGVVELIGAISPATIKWINVSCMSLAGAQHGVRGVRQALPKQDAAGSALQAHGPHQICRQGAAQLLKHAPYMPSHLMLQGICMHIEFASPCLSGMQTDEVALMDTEAQMRDARAEQNALPESSKGDDAAATDAPLVCESSLTP